MVGQGYDNVDDSILTPFASRRRMICTGGGGGG